MKFYAHGPSRPMRWDFMDVPLEAAHGQFCYAFA